VTSDSDGIAAAYWAIAAEVCTPRQLEALRLYDRGLSYRTISGRLDISHQRVAELVTRAGQKIEIELRRREADADVDTST